MVGLPLQQLWQHLTAVLHIQGVQFAAEPHDRANAFSCYIPAPSHVQVLQVRAGHGNGLKAACNEWNEGSEQGAMT